MTTNPPITLSPELDPWERQPKESARKHGQFVTYRDLGRARTLAKTAENLTLAHGHVRNTAAEYRWRERVEAWDRHLDRLYEATWLEERRKAAEADAKILGAAIGKLAQRLGTLRAEDLSPGDFIRLMDVAMRHRRVLFGDPTETIAVTGQGGNPLAVQLAEFAEMPAEQRRVRIEELAAAVQRRTRALNGAVDDDDDDGLPDEDDTEE
ncbi:hypothetical protein VSR01_17205 [Actinacidiphila sp. DG2A-62]|uniref:hypothetical protein n=1 Tax=Actinacidiphila sp. DG2A-62 TaxID=3108821 RepID=UPI002DB9D624|nr:hypothetical protein [Actinacidiphila sp. DG2A-62]MEC3995177.1 hypothetical protein [Actinacidiphila sp. DG2A-62]